MMPDFNKALMLDVSSHQCKAAESLNSLADMMRQEVNHLDPVAAWVNLHLCEFGPQLNLLTELIQENQPQEAVPEVLVDEDDDQGPPGLEAIPEDEQATAPSASAAATASPLMAWISSGHVTPLHGTSPFSAAQMASIYQTEMSQYINTVGMRNPNNEAHADVNWQETFQPRGACAPEAESNWESDGNSSDSDEPVGLFGLHVSELCLVMTRKYTMWPHMCTYV